MFECFNCLQKSVIWDADFDAEDYGYDQKGNVHVFHCTNCGADITYVCLENEEESDDEDSVENSEE